MFNDINRSTISRRQMLRALGIAAVAGPAGAFAQGRCGGPNAGTPQCNTTPFPQPFAPTGWKTVLLDHFTLKVVDLEKEAAFYNALMGWNVRSNDGKMIVMDMGTLGRAIMTGGLELPAPAAAPAPAPPAGNAAAGGRGGGRGGPRRAVWESFCWGIEPWDTKKVEADLKKRGLKPDRRPSRQRFFQLPRERSGRLRSPDQQRQQEKPADERRMSAKLNTASAV